MLMAWVYQKPHHNMVSNLLHTITLDYTLLNVSFQTFMIHLLRFIPFINTATDIAMSYVPLFAPLNELNECCFIILVLSQACSAILHTPVEIYDLWSVLLLFSPSFLILFLVFKNAITYNFPYSSSSFYIASVFNNL